MTDLGKRLSEHKAKKTSALAMTDTRELTDIECIDMTELIERGAKAMFESAPHRMLARAGYPTDWDSQCRSVKNPMKRKARLVLAPVKDIIEQQTQEIAGLNESLRIADITCVSMGKDIKSLQAKHTGLLKWAEGAKLDNEGLKSRIGEIESALRIQTAATGYWKDHWDQAYSEQHGQPPQEPKDD